MNRFFASAAALSGFIAVAVGAFGAHALKDRLDASALQLFETGVRYQMYHAFALFLAAFAAGEGDCPPALWAGRAFLLGTLLFSGSLYALALTGIRGLGAITPLGGVAFLVGWICLLFAFRRGA